MKYFIRKIILLSLPILILLLTVNYFGDPANLFDDDYENEIAEILHKEHYVTNISNYDERILQKNLISMMKMPPDLVIIGSSRTILIGNKFFPGRKIFNNSVSGASHQDLISIYQMYKEHNLIPKKIIIGIDPWLLNINSGQNRWKSIEYYYDRFFKKNPDKSFKNNIFKKYTELISLSYFQASVGMFPERITGELKPMPTKNKYNKTNTILTDGSLVYGHAYRNATQEVVNSKITKYIAGDIYSIEGFDEISVNIWNEFKVFIQDIQNQGIDIEFFLHPYAPTIYDHISNKYQNVLVVEKNIRNFAKNNNIKIYGSFNPSIYDIDETYFYDAMHCKEKGIELLMSRYSM